MYMCVPALEGDLYALPVLPVPLMHIPIVQGRTIYTHTQGGTHREGHREGHKQRAGCQEGNGRSGKVGAFAGRYRHCMGLLAYGYK
jgi:hypothetical protein